MEPFSIISGAQAVGRRFRFYITVQLVSVLAPGIVLVVGIIFVVRIFRNQLSSGATQALADEFSGATAFLAAFVLLATGYVVGYVFRELAFKLLAQVERLSRFKKQLSSAAYGHVRADFPPSLVNKCFKLHPVLHEAYERYQDSLGESSVEATAPGSAQGTGKAIQRRQGGGHLADNGYISFVYGKLWIRNYAPGFSIDNIEAEINILASAFAPSLLGGVVIVALAHGT